MLFSLDGSRITQIPRKRRDDYASWRGRLSQEDYEGVIRELNAYVDCVLAEGKECFTSSFVPGSDWTNTPYQPLYHACNMSVTQSGWFFGLILWQVMIDRPDKWYFKGTTSNDDDVLGKTYFLKRD